MCRSHEYTAYDYPDVGHRTVGRAEDGSEDGTEAGYVEELYDEDPPGLHLLVVHAVGQPFGRGGTGR